MKKIYADIRKKFGEKVWEKKGKKKVRKRSGLGSIGASGDSLSYGSSLQVKKATPGNISKGKLSITAKTVILCISIILIIAICYIGLNYFYGYELISPGGSSINLG
ncbi:MAG: hypothetical protein CVT90_01045 [Candidatus Altiarchaeales archaeon HGW-Altiarchaeales-3]|nr:MAG: hypothetical protein CVT90_01045 [Candidatus Altiarchaeales archaeon HGW-Altiarchaeales-3]